jgi:hypothetical protein
MVIFVLLLVEVVANRLRSRIKLPMATSNQPKPRKRLLPALLKQVLLSEMTLIYWLLGFKFTD